MSDLLYEVKDKVATITLNRPDKLNAFTRDMIDAWAKALTAAQQDDSVNGLAVGAGMGMCVMCDMRVAAESARFSTGYVRVGLVPGDGDTYFLPRLVGAAKALELLWTADFIEAPEAHRLGIVQRVAPDAQLREVTYALARQIADGPQIPIRMIKRLVYQSLRLDLRTHLDLVSSHMSIVRQTADHAEGVAAFKEKRSPKFEGH